MFTLHLNGAKHKSKEKRLGPKTNETLEPRVMMDGTIMLGDRPINVPMRGRGRGGRGRGGRGGGGGGKWTNVQCSFKQYENTLKII